MHLKKTKIKTKFIKCITCCILAAGLVFTGLPANIFTGNMEVKASELTYTDGNSTYKYVVNGDTVKITDWSGTDTEITVPSEIDGKTVTEIWYAAFSNCTSLTEIEIPDSVTEIGERAFESCTALKSIELSNSLITVGSYAFHYCTSLTEIIIPDSVTKIEFSAFLNCDALLNIKIPAKVEKIDTLAFAYCDKLVSIEVSEENKIYSSEDGMLYNKDKTVLLQFPNGRGGNIELPNDVIKIDDYAFESCTSLTGIKLPNSLTEIGGAAFRKCSSLKNIELLDSLTKIDSSAFQDCTSLANIELPDSLTEIGERAFRNCSSLANIELPDSLMKIDDAAFGDCILLTDIRIPAKVEEIGYWIVSGCDKLVSIEVAEENKSYSSQDGALYNKDKTELIECPLGKTNITLAQSAIDIGVYAFQEGSLLKNIELSLKLKNINRWAFLECNLLTSIYVPASVENIDAQALGFVRRQGDGEPVKSENFTIYGHKGTAAEQYALENDFKFIEMEEFSTEDNVKLQFQPEAVESGSRLVTKHLTSEDEAYQKIDINDKILDTSVNADDVKLTAYDIKLVDKNGVSVQPSGSVIVKIPCPEGYDGTKCKVYRVNANGTFTDMEAVYSDGYMLLRTNHFSTYFITETELKTAPAIISGDANGDTNVSIMDAIILKKHLAGYDTPDIVPEACDVNVDGNVSVMDAVRIMKYLAGYEVKLGVK